MSQPAGDAGESVAPAPPPVVTEVFAEGDDDLVRYADWLAREATVRGLIGPREVPRLWERHLLNSVAIADLLPVGARLVDVGSGAGLPGLALACARPDLQVDLVEPLLRRTTFLQQVVDDLGFADRVRVIRGRADDPAVVASVGGTRYVTARAVASLDKLVRWTRPLLARGGDLFAIKGDGAEEEIMSHRGEISSLGTDIVGVVECGTTFLSSPVRVVHLRRR